MDDAAVLPTRHWLTVDDYHRMADAGIFGQDERIELIDGALINMVATATCPPISQAIRLPPPWHPTSW
jgi:hypothetical protein